MPRLGRGPRQPIVLDCGCEQPGVAWEWPLELRRGYIRVYCNGCAAYFQQQRRVVGPWRTYCSYACAEQAERSDHGEHADHA